MMGVTGHGRSAWRLPSAQVDVRYGEAPEHNVIHRIIRITIIIVDAESILITKEWGLGLLLLVPSTKDVPALRLLGNGCTSIKSRSVFTLA